MPKVGSAGSRRAEPSPQAVRRIAEPRRISARMLPSTDGGSFAGQMSLGHTRDHGLYCKLVGRIAQLSDEHNVDPGDPTSAKWRAFVDIVGREFPVIDRYERAWPVAAIVRTHLRRKRDKRVDPVHRGLGHWATKGPQPPTHSPRRFTDTLGRSLHRSGNNNVLSPTTSSESRERRGRHTSVILKAKDGISSPTNHPRIDAPRLGKTATATSNAVCPPLKPSHLNQCHSGIAHPPRHTGPRPSAGVAKAASNAVLDFLRSLRPDLSDLLPVLNEKGVVDGTTLNGLVSMGPQRRRKILNAWVRELAINELQFWALEAGFEGIVPT